MTQPVASADNSQRLRRLLALLPRIYATQTRGSAVGALLDVLAQRLADFDQDLQRVMRDRWVALACGTPDDLPAAGDDEAALDRLGALLQITRLPARIHHDSAAPQDDGSLLIGFRSEEDRSAALRLLAMEAPPEGVAPPSRIPGLLAEARTGPRNQPQLLFSAAPGLAADAPPPLAALAPLLVPEPTEAYRQRLRITVGIASQGLTTPRALLSLAIADLGAAPCARFTREQDATLARAVSTSARKHCKACGDPALPCPQAALFEAWISEQPTQPAHWQASAARLRQVQTLRNDSLAADRPELEISATRPVSFPALQSRASGEIVLYADDLLPGQTLRLQPQLTAEEAAATASHDHPVTHPWLQRSPMGRAELLGPEKGAVRDVSGSVFYLWGNRFDDAAARLGGVNVPGLRCGVLEQAVRTPMLRPGLNDWTLLTFTAPAFRFDAPTARLAAGPHDVGAHFALFDGDIGQSGAAFATQLFQLLELSNDEGADPEQLPRFDLQARWQTRAPFLFNLRIPKNGWVVDAELRGAVELLLADVERARPAGVRARVDFPEPVYREAQPLAETLDGMAVAAAWAEDAQPEGTDVFEQRLGIALAEDHGPGEARPTMGAIIDTTRFDWSTLQ